MVNHLNFIFTELYLNFYCFKTTIRQVDIARIQEQAVANIPQISQVLQSVPRLVLASGVLIKRHH